MREMAARPCSPLARLAPRSGGRRDLCDALRFALVGLLRMLHRKRPGSGGDHELALDGVYAAIAVGAVAVLDVAGGGVGEGVPVEVVGVVDDELGDGAEVRL